MSRTGKKSIEFDAAAVKVSFNDRVFHCKGKNGSLEVVLPQDIDLKIEDNVISILPAKIDEKQPRSMLRNRYKQVRSSWGTARQLVFNTIKGVSESFHKTLLLEGVGFRASVAGNKLTLALGYSRPAEYTLPENVSAKVENNTKITLTSVDNQKLGKVATEIKNMRKPEPYKGKGIRFEGEIIKRKVGKTGKK